MSQASWFRLLHSEVQVAKPPSTHAPVHQPANRTHSLIQWKDHCQTLMSYSAIMFWLQNLSKNFWLRNSGWKLASQCSVEETDIAPPCKQLQTCKIVLTSQQLHWWADYALLWISGHLQRSKGKYSPEEQLKQLPSWQHLCPQLPQLQQRLLEEYWSPTS